MKRLRLRAETVRQLRPSELRDVAAGEGAISAAWCYTQRASCTCGTTETWQSE